MQMLDTYSGHSFRLMALAMGVVPCVANLDLAHTSQAHIEAIATPLRLLGVIVLSNPIKADSKEIIGELQEQSAPDSTVKICCDLQQQALKL